MAAPARESFTTLLQRHRRDGSVPLDDLLPHVYDELRGVARRQLRGADAATLEPTALVNEVYLRLVDQQMADVADRAHFHGLCARVMRQILVDRARRRKALRRGGGRVQALPTAVDVEATDDLGGRLDVLALDEALLRLDGIDSRKARVVELRLFGGLQIGEVAAALGVSRRTVEADWFFARAWLRAELGP